MVDKPVYKNSATQGMKGPKHNADPKKLAAKKKEYNEFKKILSFQENEARKARKKSKKNNKKSKRVRGWNKSPLTGWPMYVRG